MTDDLLESPADCPLAGEPVLNYYCSHWRNNRQSMSVEEQKRYLARYEFVSMMPCASDLELTRYGADAWFRIASRAFRAPATPSEITADSLTATGCAMLSKRRRSVYLVFENDANSTSFSSHLLLYLVHVH